MVEFRVNDLAVLADKSLSQLDLPKGLLIAAILEITKLSFHMVEPNYYSEM